MFWWAIVKLQPWKSGSKDSEETNFWPHIKKGMSIFFCTKLNTQADSDEVLAIFESLPSDVKKDLNETNDFLAKLVSAKQEKKRKQQELQEKNAEMAEKQEAAK